MSERIEWGEPVAFQQEPPAAPNQVANRVENVRQCALVSDALASNVEFALYRDVLRAIAEINPSSAVSIILGIDMARAALETRHISFYRSRHGEGARDIHDEITNDIVNDDMSEEAFVAKYQPLWDAQLTEEGE